jgi:DNA-binding response OmpR family regulator
LPAQEHFVSFPSPAAIATASDDARQERVLLVSDQPLLADLVKLAVNHGPYALRQATSPQEALLATLEWQPHVVLLDIERHGELLEAMATTTAAGPDGRVPVLAMMARGHLDAWLAALERGADDIIVVPFTAEELVARTVALLRRTYGRQVRFTPVIRVGPLEIDLIRRQVSVDHVNAQLTFVELSVLYLLIANAGRSLTRDDILSAVWGPDYAAESNVVDQHIHSLRTKLENHWKQPRLIATVPGQGYRFLPTEAVEPSPESVLIQPWPEPRQAEQA